MSISVNAAPIELPSFDCRKAAALSEKTICANAALSRLDFQLGRMWKTLLDSFIDSAQRILMKEDQRMWLALRTKCGHDVECIGKLYQDRLATLSGADPAHRFSGVYEVKDIGSFALFPIGSHYLVNIQTADPSNGRWECELAGEAESSGDDLEIKVEGSVFQARLQGRNTLVVSNTHSVAKVASQFCGINGTFAFTYLRVRPQP
jgi:uncharacterized protein